MIEIFLSGIAWRLRGIIGWPGTLVFSLIQAFMLWPELGEYSLLFSLWIMLGEPTGWKPKYANAGDWRKSAIYGLRIGLIGFFAVPISTAIQKYIGEPPILTNERPFNLYFWSGPKYLLNWSGAWNEFYFGIIFSSVVYFL